MRTPYIPHFFGDEVERRLRTGGWWLTAGVASSIPWPSGDVCVIYSDSEYFLRGTERDGKPSPPGISIRGNSKQIDEALGKIYRFTSILGWFLDGYVDVSEHVSGSRPFLCGHPRKIYSELGQAGVKSFNCNHMPLIEDEGTRKALAFWREGQRLADVHHGYAFLSFYKVIESQFDSTNEKVDWINAAIERLTDRAEKRVAELRTQGIDVGRHLFDSCRCAVAHASVEKIIVDPDIPQDRKRLSADLVVMQELARAFIRDQLVVPTARSLFRTRDRLQPWDNLLSQRSLGRLRRGRSVTGRNPMDGIKVSIGLWPDGPIPGLEEMTLRVDSISDGIVKAIVANKRETIFLIFLFDYPAGKVHTNLEEGGVVTKGDTVTEEDVRAYATYFYYVLCNRIAELRCEGLEPIDCEVVIPINIIPPNPEEAIMKAVDDFRSGRR